MPWASERSGAILLASRRRSLLRVTRAASIGGLNRLGDSTGSVVLACTTRLGVVAEDRDAGCRVSPGSLGMRQRRTTGLSLDFAWPAGVSSLVVGVAPSTGWAIVSWIRCGTGWGGGCFS